MARASDMDQPPTFFSGRSWYRHKNIAPTTIRTQISTGFSHRRRFRGSGICPWHACCSGIEYGSENRSGSGTGYNSHIQASDMVQEGDVPWASHMAHGQAVDTVQASDKVLAYNLAGPLHMPGHPGIGHGSGIACASGFKNGVVIHVFEASDTVQTSYFAHLSPMAQASMCFRNRTPFRHRCALGIAYGPRYPYVSAIGWV